MTKRRRKKTLSKYYRNLQLTSNEKVAIEYFTDVVEQGCGGYYDAWNGDYDCEHDYTWDCENCPINIIVFERDRCEGKNNNSEIVIDNFKI